MLMAVGIMGISIFQSETQGTLAQGQSLNIAGYEVRYKEIASWDNTGAGVNYTRSVVDIYKDGKYLGQLTPRIDYYFDSQQTMTIPGNRSTMKDDLYILLVDWEPATSMGATFKIYVNPLVNWLWFGSLLFLVGIIIAAWPENETEPVAVKAKVGVRQPSQPSAAD
jgi:cytochrome c-type biogenesis protein CcmF